MKKFLIFPACFMIISMLQAQVIHVPTDQPTIQAGINAAMDGDTVLVASGLYLENINFMGKAITVASNYIYSSDTNDIHNTVIDGSQPSHPDSASVVMFISGEDTTSVLTGFTITGGQGTLHVSTFTARIGGGIYCEGSGARISHNYVKNNHVSHDNKAGGGGIGTVLMDLDRYLIVENSTISDNSTNTSGFSAFGGGIYSSNSARIIDNLIENNQCQDVSGTSNEGGGICLERLPGSEVIYGNILDNIIRYNSIVGQYCDGGGIYSLKVPVKIKGNNVSHNHAFAEMQSYGGGINIYYPADSVIIMDNEISHNESVANDLPVAGGIFSNFNYEALIITSNSIHHNSTSGVAGHGGAMVIADNYCPVEITNNIVSNNTCSANGNLTGPIMRIISPNEQVELSHNEFSYNSASGSENSWGGIFLWDAEEQLIKVDGNKFLHNHVDSYGGAFYARNSNHLRLTNNVFDGNSTNEGYDHNGGAMLLIQNYGNDVDEFMHTREQIMPASPSVEKSMPSSPKPHTAIINNTFIYNYSGWYGGAMLIWDFDSLCPVIMNNIFWGNEAGSRGHDIYNYLGDSTYIYNCNIHDTTIWGKWTGKYNFHENPDFLDDSCHIHENSACEDAGSDSLLIEGIMYYAPEIDMEGTPRPWHMGVDVGADECDIIERLPETLLACCQDIVMLQNRPNPFSESTVISFELKRPFLTKLEIYDMTGRKIAEPLYKWLTKGNHEVTWHAGDLEAGQYFYRLTAGDQAITRKMTLIR